MNKAIKTNKLMLIGPTPEEHPLLNEAEATERTAAIQKDFPKIRIISIHKVVKEYAHQEGWQIGDFIRAEVRALMDCDAIVMMDDWEFDPKCTAIHRMCLCLGIPCIHARSKDLPKFLEENFGSNEELPESFNKPVLA